MGWVVVKFTAGLELSCMTCLSKPVPRFFLFDFLPQYVVFSLIIFSAYHIRGLLQLTYSPGDFNPGSATVKIIFGCKY